MEREGKKESRRRERKKVKVKEEGESDVQVVNRERKTNASLHGILGLGKRREGKGREGRSRELMCLIEKREREESKYQSA